MKQLHYQNLTNTLKTVLKTQKCTYAELATKIGMTESGVQKIFSGEDCSVVRLSEICSSLDLSLSELLKMSEEMTPHHRKFTAEQEEFFLANRSYFYFFWELKQAHYQAAKVQARHQLSAGSMQKYLLKLDRLGLIELHPGQEIKPLTYHKDGEHWNDEHSSLKLEFRKHVAQKYLEFLLVKEQSEETSCKLAVMNMKKETLLDYKEALHQIQMEYLNRVHRENPFVKEEELITIGNLNALTPFTYSDIIEVPNLD